MYDYKNSPRHDILCVDMKSFYASVECIMRGLDPTVTLLAVVGDINRKGSVVLASSPTLKKQYKIRTGSRLYEIENINDPNIIVVGARMDLYIRFSKFINEIYNEFVPPEALHVYSVDESWLTLDGTKKLWGDPREAAKKIRSEIYHLTGLVSTVGIGDNKVLSKIALDNYGKHQGIGEIRYEDVKTKLHPLKIKDMWGVGYQMEKHFYNMGIYTVGDLANTPLELIKNKFGKSGENLHFQSWGIDFLPVIYNDPHNPPQSVFGFTQGVEKRKNIKSVGRGITLLKDYIKKQDIELVIKEIAEEVCYELRKEGLEGKTIHVEIGYSKNTKDKGFSRQKSIKIHTNDLKEILKVAYELFEKNHIQNSPVRKVRISVSNLREEDITEMCHEKLKRRELAITKDILNDKYGKGTITFGTSLYEESVSKERNKKVGGHYM